jgi:putative transposase
MSSNSSSSSNPDAGSNQLPRPKTKITDEQIDALCIKLGLSDVAKAHIRRMNASDPVRMGAGTRSVRGWFPSSIMDCMLGYESRTCELSFLWLRHDQSRAKPDRPKIILCQPCFLDVESVREDGRKVPFKYPPDYFEASDVWAGYVECKWQEELEAALDPAHKNYAPWRYKQIAPDEWVSPPAEAAAARHGLKHRIWVMSKKKVQLIENLQFLAQYFEPPTDNFKGDVAERIQNIVKGDPGIRLRDIQAVLEEDEIDTLFFCVAKQQLYVDIEREAISPNFTTRVFPNVECAELTLRMEDATAEVKVAPNACLEVIVSPGTELTIEGKASKVVRCMPGENLVEIREVGTDMNVSMTYDELERAVITGKAHQTTAGFAKPADYLSAMKEWRSVDPDEWPVMQRRHSKIERFLASESWGSRRLLGIPTRNQFRHIKMARAAGAKFGPGFEVLGLRPKARSGNRNTKMDQDTLRILRETITDNYTTTQAPSVELVWGICILKCEATNPPLKAPCRRTVSEHIEKIGAEKLALSREGSKVAYAIQMPYWDDTHDGLSINGEFAWAVAHIDHTQLDAETAPTADGLSLGRPWLTVMVAPRQKRVLAFYLSYEPPSYRSCMAVMEECVRRHHRLPAIIVTDGGKEFTGNYFSHLVARLKIVQMFRPPVTPRFGSYLERFNGRINSKLIHNLPGNTKLTVRVRMLVKSHDPKRLATLSLADLDAVLEEFAYKWMDNEPDPITGQTPKQRYDADFRLGGPRTHMIVVPNAEFYILTCPTTKSGVAKVRRDGVKVNNIYYNCRQFRKPGVLGRKFHVKYNPKNLSIIYIRIDGEWITCICRQFQNEFKGLSERELRLATTLLLAACKTLIEKRRKINASRLAQFFREHGLTPEVQMARKRAKENAKIIDRRNGNSKDQPPAQIPTASTKPPSTVHKGPPATLKNPRQPSANVAIKKRRRS